MINGEVYFLLFRLKFHKQTFLRHNAKSISCIKDVYRTQVERALPAAGNLCEIIN